MSLIIEFPSISTLSSNHFPVSSMKIPWLTDVAPPMQFPVETTTPLELNDSTHSERRTLPKSALLSVAGISSLSLPLSMRSVFRPPSARVWARGQPPAPALTIAQLNRDNSVRGRRNLDRTKDELVCMSLTLQWWHHITNRRKKRSDDCDEPTPSQPQPGPEHNG